MSGWLVIAFTIAGLVIVAVAVLITDVARGDVGGGRHTLERARRLLVVATDDETHREAERWMDEQTAERPDMQFFLLVEPEGQGLYLAVEEAIERDRPDAVVMARHADDSHTTLAGTFGRLKEDMRVPVDAIYIGQGEAIR